MPLSHARKIPVLQGRSPEPFVANIPGSKSMTNRGLLIAAMRMGKTEVAGALDCEDSQALANALDAFDGLSVDATPTGFRVERSRERVTAPTTELDMGAAGTPARFLIGFAAAAAGATVVTGTQRLCERPMDDLLSTLREIGIRCDCLDKPGCLPVRVHGGRPTKSSWPIGAEVSSQFTSSLLLLASQQAGETITLELQGNQASQPYVEMTRSMMAQCGIRTERPEADQIVVHADAPGLDRIEVEADASSMSYFLGLAAITETTVVIPGIGTGTTQGDIRLTDALADMGCAVNLGDQSIQITGRPLQGTDIDMGSMPDVALTLAAVAAFASTPTRIRNLANLRVKESDRLRAAATELQRLGCQVEEGEDSLSIQPTGIWHPALVRTYDDHRVAMAMSLPGLLQPGVAIDDPACVAKSFPNYWQEFDRFYAHHEAYK